MEKACHSYNLEKLLKDMFQGRGLVPRKKRNSMLETKMNKLVNMGKSEQ